MSEQINSVDFWVEELTHDINPEHFNHHENFIPYMHDEKISSFGNWMWNNGYNVGLFNLQAKVNTYCVPQWISVKDRLPETNDDVLVWFEYFRYGDFNCMCNQYGIGNYIDNSWLINGETGWKKLNVISWMPIPEMPKENNNET